MKVRKKLVLLALIVAVLSPVSARAAVKGVVVSPTGLNVREKALSTSKQIGSVVLKTEVEILAQTHNWYKIKYGIAGGSQTGYILKKYVRLSEKGKIKKIASQAKKKTAKTKKKKNKSITVLNEKKSGKAQKNSVKATATQKTDIKKDSKNKEKIAKAKNKKAKSIKSAYNKQYQSVIISTPLLNVRAKNNKKSSIIATVQEDETYPIVSATKNWVKIALTANSTGYVMRQYVDFSVQDAGKQSQTDEYSTPDNNVNISNNNTNDNSNNSTSSNTSIVNNTTNNQDSSKAQPDYSEYFTEEQLREQNRDLAESEYLANNPGAIIKKPITDEGPANMIADTINFTPVANTVAECNVKAVNVRKDTNTDSPILAILLKGGMLEVVGDSPDWVKVRLDDNVGYIKKEFVNIKEGILKPPVVDDSGARTKSDSSIIKPTGGTGEDVTKFAKQFLGNPYIWGGTSLTKGTDCSGFIQSVYKYFGYNLKRTSTQQRTEGISIANLSDAVAGDLICYDGHIGIYLGQGKGIIHASNPRSGIIITSNASYRPIIAIRRIIH